MSSLSLLFVMPESLIDLIRQWEGGVKRSERKTFDGHCSSRNFVGHLEGA